MSATLQNLIEAHRPRLALRFLAPDGSPCGIADTPSLNGLPPIPLNDAEVTALAGEAMPSVYSLDHGDFVILCADELDAARKRRAMAAEYDQGAADSWVYLILVGDGRECGA